MTPSSRRLSGLLFVAVFTILGPLGITACSSNQSALRTDGPQTWTGQIATIERDAETKRPSVVTLNVIEYATTNDRVSLLRDLDGSMVTENMDPGLKEGDKVELYYHDSMPPQDRKALETGQSVRIGVKYLDVTPPVLIGGE